MKTPKPYIHPQTGYYSFTYTDPVTKKRKIKSTGTKDESEAWTFIVQFMQNIHLAADSLHEYIKNFYVPGKCPIMQVRHVGVEHARNQHRIIEKYIMTDPISELKINNIKRGQVLDFCSRLIKKYRPKQAEKIYRTLRAVMTAAEFREDININPCRGIGKDYFYRHLSDEEKMREVDIFTSTEIEMIFSEEYTFFDLPASRIAFLIANEAGLRRSEILALQWGCINWASEIINITRAWKTWNKREKIIGPPKWNKNRIVPLTKSLRKELKEYQEDVITCKKNDFVICWENGTPYSPKVYHQWFVKILKRLVKEFEKLGIENDIDKRNLKPHSFRHGFITRLREADIPDDVVMAVAGHSNKKVTQGYTHYSPEYLVSFFR